MPTRPVVHIGIVTFNSLADLPQCFAGIRQQTYPHIRISVLDNASVDESADWVAANCPDVFLLRSPDNLGFGRGHNRIIGSLADGEYYMALNPDVGLLPGYIEAVVNALESNLSAGWATGKLIQPDGHTLYSIGHALLRDGYAFNIGYGLPDRPDFNISREVFGAPGAAVIFTDRLLAAKPVVFEEVMFLYAEDTDFDWAARRQGWVCLYVAEAIAHHRGSQPKEALRVESLTNRYLSVFKNAYGVDLIFYNLPRIVLHVLLRCVITPRLGLRMAGRLIRLFPVMLGKRQKPVISRQDMHRWFRWSNEQPIEAYPSLMWRLRSFITRRKA